MAVAVDDGVDVDVGEDPLRRHQLADPDRVVQAAPRDRLPGRRRERRRHEVADQRQLGRIGDVALTGQAHPVGGPPTGLDRGLAAQQLAPRHAAHDAHVEQVVDRAVGLGHGSGAVCLAGAGTSGGSAYVQCASSSRCPSVASTVRISSSPWNTVPRACVVRAPTTGVCSRTSSVAGIRTNDRYCAVAHTSARPVDTSRAAITAASPAPPYSAPRAVVITLVIGSDHRIGSAVGSRPIRSTVVTSARRRAPPAASPTGTPCR